MDHSPLDAAARRLRTGTVSSRELTDECLRQIERDNPRLNAFITVTADMARSQAAEADRELAAGIDRGPLHGIPISVKDLFDIAGLPTTAGSHVRDGIVAATDAPTIVSLRRAGAVIVGKTNLHEFAMGPTNEDSAFGPVRNPFDDTRISGGSSGGSAVSVATGMAFASLGSDTGGSIRIPAAACGVVGLKPSLGELSADGAVPLSRTLDHVGPIAASVTDTWHLLHALRDRVPVKTLEPTPARALRLGVPRGYFLELLEDDVRRRFDEAIETLRREGAVVSDVSIPHASLVAPIYTHIVFGDAAAYHADALDAVPERYTANVRIRLEMARYVTAEDYVRALEGRKVLTREVDAALVGVDALAVPTLPAVAPPLGASTVRLGHASEPVRNAMLRLTQIFNLTGHPAISLPCGRASSGLPIGLQLAGSIGQTDALLHVARGVELVLQNPAR